MFTHPFDTYGDITTEDLTTFRTRLEGLRYPANEPVDTILLKLRTIKNCVTPLTAQDKEQLFKIDKVCTQAVIHAERKCCHIFVGGKPYKTKLNKLGRIIDTWRMIIKKKLGRHISSKQIQ